MNSKPTLLVEVSNKPDDIFQMVKERIEACRAACCEKNAQNEADAMPYAKLERTARGRELDSYERREIAANDSGEYGWVFCWEDFWFGDDAFSAFPCGCQKYPGDVRPQKGADGQYVLNDGHNDCGADWRDQITGCTFTNADGFTGSETFVGNAEQGASRNGRTTVHYWCSTPVATGGSGFGGYESSKSSAGRQPGFGPGFFQRLPREYTRGNSNTIGTYVNGTTKITDQMAWHNYVTTRSQGSKWWSTFGARECTGKYTGHKNLVESPPSQDAGFIEYLGSYWLWSAEEYIGRIVTNVNSSNEFYVFTSSGKDRDGEYSPTRKRVFTIGDTVRLAVEDICSPGPNTARGTDWVGTITDLAYGTFNMDVCEEPLCNGICSAAYIRGDIPGLDCTNNIGDPPNCRAYAADEWKGKGDWPSAKSLPNELLPPSEWPVVSEGDGWENTSCNPNIFTITGFRYTVAFDPDLQQQTAGLVNPPGSKLQFSSTPGGTMFHAFASDSIDSIPARKVRWDFPPLSDLDQWICKNGEGQPVAFANSMIQDANHWQSEPGGMVFWGATGGKAYFTLENEDIRYDTDATNQQPDYPTSDGGNAGGYANYSPGAPYMHIETNYMFPQVGAGFQNIGSISTYVSLGPFIEVEGVRNAYNWNRARCGNPDVYWQAQFFEFDCEAGKISNQSDIHAQLITCDCGMSYGAIPWVEYTGKAAPEWWPWKKPWSQGIDVRWKCNETNTRAYHIVYPRQTQEGEFVQAEVYSWGVDQKLYQDEKWQEFADACKFENAPEGGIQKVRIPGDQNSFPYDLAWNEERPWVKPPKWGYWYWDYEWVPPKK